MNEIKIFENSEFGQMGVMEIDGKCYFPATECAKMLGYTEPEKAVRMHCKGVSKLDSPSNGGVQKKNFITEGDLYRLIIRSKLPSAEKFERWVFDEVLPAIRKHGGYLTPEKVEEALLNPDTLIRLATELKDEREKRRALESKVAEDRPFTGFGRAIAASSDAILVREFAKLANNAGIQIDQNRLYGWLRERGYLMRDNKPYQKYVDSGWFKLKESTITTIEGNMVRTTTLITGKGQMALMQKLKEEMCA